MGGIIKKRFKIEGMHCASCALVIDLDLEDLPGVEKVAVSYAKQIAEVEFDERKIKEEEIIKAISQSGFKASPLDVTS